MCAAYLLGLIAHSSDGQDHSAHVSDHGRPPPPTFLLEHYVVPATHAAWQSCRGSVLTIVR
jgi:hypothetical protein